MTSSARWLAILAGIAGLLLAVLLVAGPRDHGAVDRSLVAGFDPARVSELDLTRGTWSAHVVRDGERWRIDAPPGTADPAAIDAIFTALRGGRWHRRAGASAAGAERARLRVNGTTLSVRAELPGSGQTWLVRGDEALLVDSWVATALAPEPLALRVRHPLDCAGASKIVATTVDGTLRIEGSRVVEPHALWLDDRAVSALGEACARVEIVALGGQRAVAGPGLSIEAGATKLVEVGTCDGGRILVETSSGAGCVEATALAVLRDALHAIVAAPETVIDQRPLPIDPAKLTLADGSKLELAGTPRIAAGGDITDADRDRVRELVAALGARGVSTEPRPRTAPAATIVATGRDRTEVRLELWDHAIGRAGEPAMIRIADPAWQVITRPASALRDATRWREDATTISSVTLDGVTYTRGAALGEWIRERAGSVAADAALVDALAETLATVRAPAAAAPPRHVAHRLSVTITPPAGAPTTHAIELGTPTADGCPGRVDGEPVLVPLPLCTAAIALASAR